MTQIKWQYHLQLCATMAMNSGNDSRWMAYQFVSVTASTSTGLAIHDSPSSPGLLMKTVASAQFKDINNCSVPPSTIHYFYCLKII